MFRKLFDKPREYWFDLVELVGGTFVVMFLTTWLGPVLAKGTELQPHDVVALFSLGILEKAGVAALAATLALVKGLVGGLMGNPETTKWLPRKEDSMVVAGDTLPVPVDDETGWRGPSDGPERSGW